MTTIVKVLIGLVVGYVVGIGLAAFAAFVLDLDDLARFVAVGCGITGAIVGPIVLADRDLGGR